MKPRSFAPGPLRGTLRVPGDKSISHRALVLGAYAPQPLRIVGLNDGRDVTATLEALMALGARIERDETGLLVSAPSLREPMAPIDCMNSGSTARMMLGLCAGADIRASFEGDASLRRRPMEPVAAQLRAFGAKIETTDGRLPMRINGTPEVQTRDFILVSPSAQVKTALLFAGLFRGVAISLTGDRATRDHTERLFSYLGADVQWTPNRVTFAAPPTQRHDVFIPGDFSSAAFFLVAAVTTPQSELRIEDVGVNPTRTGLLDALLDMGADIDIVDRRDICGEPVATLNVRYAPLHATSVTADLTVRAVDEIPVLAVAAAYAEGTTTFAGVRDLRSKESDRVAAIEAMLAGAGIQTESEHNRLVVHGGKPAMREHTIATHDDHRIAMAAAILACGAGALTIDSDASIDVSFPDFIAALERVQQA